MEADLTKLVGRDVVGVNDQKLGKINAIYLNKATGSPEWVAIKIGGLLGAKVGFAPVGQVALKGDHAIVDFDKNHLKNAPRPQTQGVLSPDENDRLHRYYFGTPPAQPAGGQEAGGLIGG